MRAGRFWSTSPLRLGLLPMVALWGCGGIGPRPSRDADSGAGGSPAGSGGDAATDAYPGGRDGTGADAPADGGGAAVLPNVLILFTDDQRFNTVNALGNPLIQTPNMDRLARAGTAFSQATCLGGVNGALCVSSRASLMTGRTINHLDGAGDVIPPEHTTLPEMLRQAGYVTFATGKWHSDRASFARLFDHADNIFFGGMHFPEDGGHEHPRLYHFDPTGAYPASAQFVGDKFSSIMYADAAIGFLETLPAEGRPFFGYVAFTAPHDPRTPPAPFAAMYDAEQIPLPDNFLPQHPFDNGDLYNRDEMLLPIPRDPDQVRRQIAAYYGMISEVDAEIGRILDTLVEQKLQDRTLVIFAGDNGLALGAHGLLGKQNLYEESLRIPMIVAGPGVAANFVDERFIHLSDLLPTVAGLLGLAPPATSEGSPLLGPTAVGARPVGYFQYADLHRAIRTTDHWKLIGYRRGGAGAAFDHLQLFNLANDPSELFDLSGAAGYQPKLEEMLSDLAGERSRYDDPLLSP
jgi:arylsulfatase A-like enzyme